MQFDDRAAIPMGRSATATIAPNGYQVPDIGALSNPNNGPFIIDAVRFTFYHDPSDSLFGGYKAKAMRFRFTLGPHEITRDFVPVGMLGRALNTTRDDAIGYTTVVAANARSNAPTYSCFTWRPKVPFILRPGEALVPEIRHFQPPGITTTASHTVTISYLGRAFPVGYVLPSTAQLPFVAMFTPTRPASGVMYANELDLRSPFDVPLNIHRIAGMVSRDGSGANGQGQADQIGMIPAVSGDFNLALTVQRDDAEITRGGPLSFSATIDRLYRVWDIPFVLEPREKVNAVFTGFPTATEVLAPALALHGYREVVL